MRYISLLLLGLISATYALPAPSPVGDPSRKSQAVDSNRPADTTDVSHAQAGANPLSHLAWEYYHQDRQPYTSEAGKKLKADKKLFQKIQDWSKNLIEERTFKAVFGITLKLYKHLELPWDEFKLDPRELIFRTFGPIPSGQVAQHFSSSTKADENTPEEEASISVKDNAVSPQGSDIVQRPSCSARRSTTAFSSLTIVVNAAAPADDVDTNEIEVHAQLALHRYSKFIESQLIWYPRLVISPLRLMLNNSLENQYNDFTIQPRILSNTNLVEFAGDSELNLRVTNIEQHTTNEPEDHKLPYIEFPFNVNVDFASRANQEQIVLSFKRFDENVREYGNVELWIPIIEEDRELFKECDALLFPESVSSHSSHNPSTLNSAQSSNAPPTLNPSRSFNGPSTAESLTLSDHPHNSGPFASDHNGFDDPPPPYSPYPTRY
ncbi:hypothetical protein FB446DRAFT_704700 [Lentinula raphanica]|nr:hypothetical protein FB446DRAFT_704700 [Lentinula raphanica]